MQDPELIGEGQQPVPMGDEVFILHRTGVTFSANASRETFTGNGDLYLSTLRLVFVCKGSGNIGGFDLPLATLTEEQFNQPIFSANNLTGITAPLPQSGIADDIRWKLAFNNGGVNTFLHIFFRLLHEMRSQLQQQGTAPQPPVPHAVAEQILHAAYIDPNDPTTLYVSTTKQ